MAGQLVLAPLFLLHSHAGHALQFAGHRRQQRLVRAQRFQQRRHIVGHRHEMAAARLGQAANQGLQLLAQQTGHQPGEPLRVQLLQRAGRDDDRDAVAVAGGVEAVFQRQPHAVPFQLIGKGATLQVRAVGQQKFVVHEQRLALMLAGLLFVPRFQMRQGVQPGRQALVVEQKPGLLVHQDVAPAQLVLHLFEALQALAVGGDEFRFAGQLAGHQALTDHQFAGQLRFQRAVVHAPPGGENQPEQIDLFLGHHTAALLRPVRLEILALDQVRRFRFHPLRFNPRHAAREQAAGLHLLGGHQPTQLRFLVAAFTERRARPEQRLAVAGGKPLTVFVAGHDVTQQAGEQRPVQAFVVRRFVIERPAFFPGQQQ